MLAEEEMKDNDNVGDTLTIVAGSGGTTACVDFTTFWWVGVVQNICIRVAYSLNVNYDILPMGRYTLLLDKWWQTVIETVRHERNRKHNARWRRQHGSSWYWKYHAYHKSNSRDTHSNCSLDRENALILAMNGGKTRKSPRNNWTTTSEQRHYINFQQIPANVTSKQNAVG